MYQVDLNLLVGVMTFTFSPLHYFYATIVEGGPPIGGAARSLYAYINCLCGAVLACFFTRFLFTATRP